MKDEKPKKNRPSNLQEFEQNLRQIESRLKEDLDKLDQLRVEAEERLGKEMEQLVAASGYSMRGLRFAALNERAFRLELLLAIILVPLALWLGDSFTERAILIGVTLMVLVVELLNSAIEATVDRISLDRHELSGRAKDLASAAVWMSLLIAAIVWLDKLFQVISG